MRLLSTDSSVICVKEFHGEKIPAYAILSHTWKDPQDEVTFQDINEPYQARARSKPGWSKIQAVCALAAANRQAYVWIDTCCIDKSSSAELSESINSMYTWYQKAEICYAYLEDVPKDPEKCHWKHSRWFTRGWTLQELIAPSKLEFYSKDWRPLGMKDNLRELLTELTGIDRYSLGGGDIRNVSIARRMHWASHRETTKEEDQAYSLLGIFDVNMPLLYGEGGAKAFLRLQEEILKRSDDQSIFAWTSIRDDLFVTGLLAPSPRNFATSSDINLFPARMLNDSNFATVSPEGLGMQLIAAFDTSHSDSRMEHQLIILDCEIGPSPGLMPAIWYREFAGIKDRSLGISRVAAGFQGSDPDIYGLRIRSTPQRPRYIKEISYMSPRFKVGDVHNSNGRWNMEDLSRRSFSLQQKPIDYGVSFQNTKIRICISEALEYVVEKVNSTGYWDPNTNFIDLWPPSNPILADLPEPIRAEIVFSDGSKSFFVCIRHTFPESASGIEQDDGDEEDHDNGVRCRIYRERFSMDLMNPILSPSVLASFQKSHACHELGVEIQIDEPVDIGMQVLFVRPWKSQ